MPFYTKNIKRVDKDFKFKTVGLNKMSKNIDKLKPTFSTGCDEISSFVIKDQKEILVPLLTHIFNLIIIKENYPDTAKHMKVLPKLKKDKDNMNPEDYRDINIANSIAKIFDREMHEQIIDFINKNDIINDNHTGGMKGMSTIDAIEIIHKKLLKSRIENTPSIYISIDQTGAFSMINHEIMIKKLEHIGIRDKSSRIMSSYLKNRFQKTYFNGSYSSYRHIGDSSSFQGTILASLLYTLYILDQPSIVHISCTHKNDEKCEKNISINYIDDNNTELTSDKWDDLEKDAENYLRNQKTYHDNNQLLINMDKTIIMINTKKKRYRKKKVIFENVEINHSKKFIMLGMIYNEKLNFFDHIYKGTSKKIWNLLEIKTKNNFDKKN